VKSKDGSTSENSSSVKTPSSSGWGISKKDLDKSSIQSFSH